MANMNVEVEVDLTVAKEKIEELYSMLKLLTEEINKASSRITEMKERLAAANKMLDEKLYDRMYRQRPPEDSAGDSW